MLIAESRTIMPIETLADQATLRSGEVVEAVVTLARNSRGRILNPDEVEDVACRAMHSAHRATGLSPTFWKVFKNMASFVVVASRNYISGLEQVKGVAGVILNEPGNNPTLIRPVNRRSVKLD